MQTMLEKKAFSTKPPSLKQTCLCIAGIVSLIFWGSIYYKNNIHSIMLLAIIWTVCHALWLDGNFERVKESIHAGMRQSVAVFSIYILIGVLIASFILSGAIPALIYYGLDFLSPNLFLPVGLLLCSLMSLCTGTCWGTIGTMGVALIGIAKVLGIPLDITAGMIVSGAYFGDKLSPASDTTVLSSLSTHTALYRHIKGMTYTLIPAYCVTLSLFWLLGAHFMVHSSLYVSQVAHVQKTLLHTFHISLIEFIPPLIMFLFCLKRIPAEISMTCASLSGLLIAIIFQHTALSGAINSLFLGPQLSSTGCPLVDDMISHGGISSMLGSLSLTLLILSLGGILQAYGFIEVLFKSFIRYLQKPTLLVSATIIICTLCNMLVGEAYLTIIVAANVFKQSYEDLHLDSSVLSKAIEEGATFSTPLIPWTTSGVFIATLLGVNPFHYLPFSFLNWIAPLFFIGFTFFDFMGIQQFKAETAEQSGTANYQQEAL